MQDSKSFHRRQKQQRRRRDDEDDEYVQQKNCRLGAHPEGAWSEWKLEGNAGPVLAPAISSSSSAGSSSSSIPTEAPHLPPSYYTTGSAACHKEIACAFAQLFEEQIRMNDARMAACQPWGLYNDSFCGPNHYQISVTQYIERIIFHLTGLVQYELQSGRDAEIQADLGLRYMIAGMILIGRMTRVPCFLLCSRNIHRLLITSVTVAAKFLDDKQPGNEFFAMVGGLTKKELNFLETSFCIALRFDLVIQPEEFEAFYASFLLAPRISGMLNFGEQIEMVQEGKEAEETKLPSLMSGCDSTAPQFATV